MGSCIQVIFSQKLAPKKQSLLSKTSPQKLNSTISQQSWASDNFYCVSSLPEIQEFLDKIYKQLYIYTDQIFIQKSVSPICVKDKHFLEQNLNILHQFTQNAKDKNSLIYRKFIHDKAKMVSYQTERLQNNIGLNKKTSSMGNKPQKGNKQKQLKLVNITNQQIQNNILLLKLEIKMLIIKPGSVKSLQLFLDDNKISTFSVKNQSKILSQDSKHRHRSLRAQNGRKTSSNIYKQQFNKSDSKLKNNPVVSSSSGNIGQQELINYQIGQFISVVTDKDKIIVLLVPETNLKASIPAQDFIYKENSIILNDFIALKKKGSDDVLGYVMLQGQAFLYQKFESDYKNIRKQHQILQKQMKYCLNQDWQQLYDVKNSSASQSQKLARNQSLYSQYPKQSMQFQLKM